jgi:hypothetical protein
MHLSPPHPEEPFDTRFERLKEAERRLDFAPACQLAQCAQQIQ